jgi:hypothetical protein
MDFFRGASGAGYFRFRARRDSLPITAPAAFGRDFRNQISLFILAESGT